MDLFAFVVTAATVACYVSFVAGMFIISRVNWRSARIAGEIMVALACLLAVLAFVTSLAAIHIVLFMFFAYRQDRWFWREGRDDHEFARDVARLRKEEELREIAHGLRQIGIDPYRALREEER